MKETTNCLRYRGFIVKVKDTKDDCIKEVYLFKYRVQVKRWVRSCNYYMNGPPMIAEWYTEGKTIPRGRTEYIDLCDMNDYAEVEEIGV